MSAATAARLKRVDDLARKVAAISGPASVNRLAQELRAVGLEAKAAAGDIVVATLPVGQDTISEKARAVCDAYSELTLVLIQQLPPMSTQGDAPATQAAEVTGSGVPSSGTAPDRPPENPGLRMASQLQARGEEVARLRAELDRLQALADMAEAAKAREQAALLNFGTPVDFDGPFGHRNGKLP